MTNRLHNVMAAVHRAVKTPPPLVDPEGVRPVLHVESAYVELARWICAEVEPKIATADEEAWREVLPLVRKPTLTDIEAKKLRARLGWERYGLIIPESSPGTTVLLGAAMEAYVRQAGGAAGKGARAAAVAATKLLGPSFIPRLDREILRLEAITLLDKQGLAVPAPVVETCWRGVTGVKTTHSIVRLGDGSYGLIAKTRGRWTFTAGTRDDVVASLAEHHMESAVARLVGGNIPARTTVELVVQSEVDFPVAKLVRVGGAVVAVGEKAHQRVAWRLDDGASLDLIPEGSGQEALAVNYEEAHRGYLETVAPVEPKGKAKTKIFRAVAPDGRTASWRWGETEKTVTVAAPDGSPLFEIEAPLAKITRVGFAGSNVAVACGRGKRLATFDAKGVQRHTIDGRDLGETIDELVPLSSGRVFAFSAYPRGHALLVDADGRSLGSFKLGKFYAGYSSALLDAGDQVVFACSGRPSGARMIVLRVPATQS
jgi:hypothetical protein